MEKSKVKIRADINGMVKDIKLVKEKGRYGSKNVCHVTLFNGVVIDFRDNEGLYDLLNTYHQCGKWDEIFKSRKLVEEVKNDSVIDEVVDEKSGTYVCVLYATKDRDFRLFLERPYIDRLRLDEYYKVWKSQQKPQGQN